MTVATPLYQVELLDVPEHQTRRMTIDNPDGKWVFTWARTGCLRVQRGDFTAYVPDYAIEGLMLFLQDGPPEVVR